MIHHFIEAIGYIALTAVGATLLIWDWALFQEDHTP
ncbi:hypothetical protein ES705_23534 [subsurface metagenome]